MLVFVETEQEFRRHSFCYFCLLLQNTNMIQVTFYHLSNCAILAFCYLKMYIHQATDISTVVHTFISAFEIFLIYINDIICLS